MLLCAGGSAVAAAAAVLWVTFWVQASPLLSTVLVPSGVISKLQLDQLEVL